MSHAILLISCPDQRGITASVTQFVFEHRGNVVDADQHLDRESATFFMRVEWELSGFDLQGEAIAKAFLPLAEKFNMNWSLSFTDAKPRVAIFVSKHLHCLYDLLYRHRSGQLACEIPLIISNHPDALEIARDFDVDYHEIHISKENKLEQERREIQILKDTNIDVVVLARYHQILTQQFVEAFPNQIINIHHSFLPAFVGKNPYAQAHEKGVKIIGATGHYVIEDLDQGPIIDQDTCRITHRDSVRDLIRKGEDLERMVLFRALRWHLEKKVLVFGNKTVVFE